MNPNGVRDHFYQTCHEPGHVHGCPGRAGGDHELVIVYCTLCSWHGDIGGEAHAALIHPDESTAVVQQMDKMFIVLAARKAELEPIPEDWFEDDEGYVRAPLENRGTL